MAGTAAGDMVVQNYSGYPILFGIGNVIKMRIEASGQLVLTSTISNGTYTYTLPGATGTLALTSQIPVVTGYVPYTGATGAVNLGIYSISAGNTSTFSNGSSLSAVFSNGGGVSNFNSIELRGGTAGTAVNWQISKDNSTGNAFELAPSTTAGGTTYGSPVLKILNTGAATFSSSVTATSLIKSGGTSTQFLMADGSVTSSTFAKQYTRTNADLNTMGISYASSGIYAVDNNANAPSTFLYGSVYAFWNDDISTQFYVSYNGNAYWRKSIGATYTGSTWRTLLDSTTYSSYALPLTGGTITGTLDVTSTISTSGSFVSTVGGTSELRLRGGGYGGSYNTSLRSLAGAIGILQFGNNANNYVLIGNTAAGGYLEFRVNCASESVTAGSKVLTLNANATAQFESTVTVIGDITANAGSSTAITVYNASSIRAKLSMTGNEGDLSLYGSSANTLVYLSAYYDSYVNGKISVGTTTNTGQNLTVYSATGAGQVRIGGVAPTIYFTDVLTNPANYIGLVGLATQTNNFFTGTAAGDFVMYNSVSGYRLYVVNYSGGVYLTSGATSWTANSDIRLKNINSHIENAVEKLSTLQTINFSYKDDKFKKQNLGLIAQEVEKIFPELIDKNNDGMLGVRYTELVPVLIKAVQELKEEINQLKQLKNK